MIEKLTRYFTIFILAIFTSPTIFAQSKTQNTEYKIKSSSLGIAGSSKTLQTSKGKYVVSQSLGQSSVIGTYSQNGYYLRQGFQQPHNKIVVQKSIQTSSLKALVFPNPFSERITISFKEQITNNILVEIHDVAGKMVYNHQFLPSKTIQFNLNNLSAGSYVLKAISNGKILNSKLIKI